MKILSRLSCVFAVLVAVLSFVRAQEGELKPPPEKWSVRVLTSDGAPAANAKVFEAVQRDLLRVTDGEISFATGDIMQTNDEGVFTAHETGKHQAFVEWTAILHGTGFAIAAITHETPEIRLKPWHSVSGKLAGKRGEWDTLVYFVHTYHDKFNRRNVAWSASVPVAADGTFTIEKLPEASVVVAQLQRPPVAGEKPGLFNGRYQFPTVFSVPAKDPLVVAEDRVAVSGKVDSGVALPSLIRLMPKNRYFTHRVFSAKDGRFAIPGVSKGDYDLVAYSAGEDAEPNDFSTATVLVPVTVADGNVNLAALAPYKTDYVLAIQNTTTITAETLKRVEEKAKELCPHAIERISIGEITKPDDFLTFGALVTYVLQPNAEDATSAKQTFAIIELPFGYGTEMDNGYLSVNTLHVVDEDFKETSTHDKDMRIFPLKSHKLILEIPKSLKYETALALLQAIEDNKLKIKPIGKVSEFNTLDDDAMESLHQRQAGNKPTAADLPKIREINFDGETLEIRTREAARQGKTFTLEKSGNNFLFVREGSWRL